MRIVWDEPKRLANLARHGLDFADFEEGFDLNECVIRPTAPSRTGRARLKLIGMFNDEVVAAAVVSPLGVEALSIVSLRHANEAERRLYAEGS